MAIPEFHSENAPLVYVIVLNYNGREHLEYCLPSIMGSIYPNFKVLFVDNASTDDSLEFVRRNFSQMDVLQTGKNLGWAGGNNAGIAEASHPAAWPRERESPSGSCRAARHRRPRGRGRLPAW